MARQSFDNNLFIDEDEHVTDDGMATYESIVIGQIRECARILSKEMIGGYYRSNHKGTTEKYEDDVRENVINAVDVLRMLLQPFTAGIDDIRIVDIIKEIDEQKKQIQIKYKIPVNMVQQGTIAHKEFIEYKARRYRDVYGVLLNIYHKRKSDIAKMSEE
jgi:hypothetical protein